MRPKICGKVLSVLLGVGICVYGQDVHYNYDRDTNFASYRTYQWVELSGRVPHQLIDRDIKRSIDEQAYAERSHQDREGRRPLCRLSGCNRPRKGPPDFLIQQNL